MPVIGFLNGASPQAYGLNVAGFLQGLKQTGYIEGQNVTIEYRWAEGQYDRLPGLAADLVRRHVAVIAANTPAVPAAKAATTMIPIVFLSGDDPVEHGLVKTLNRPGGNLTGVSTFASALGGKQLGVFRELVPAATSFAALVNPTNPNSEAYLRGVQEAARTLGQPIHILNASTETEIDKAFQGRADALIVAPDAFLINRIDQLVALAARHALPTMYPFREFPVAGGLIGYGTNLPDLYRQVGVYTGKVLQGAKPADLPVLQPTKFELVINLKTARALGLTIPPGVLAIADEVIE
jgi:putative ABC transport system substrate-binding protein